jgi:hypothetical protein
VDQQAIITEIKSWDPAYGIADQLRCAAMSIQEASPAVTVREFSTAAEVAGFNPKTAARCWAFVKSQGN